MKLLGTDLAEKIAVKKKNCDKKCDIFLLIQPNENLKSNNKQKEPLKSLKCKSNAD